MKFLKLLTVLFVSLIALSGCSITLTDDAQEQIDSIVSEADSRLTGIEQQLDKLVDATTDLLSGE